jgi:DNA (cytosine-5)-methyltransferase 1
MFSKGENMARRRGQKNGYLYKKGPSWILRWRVEIDDYCRLVLAKHWPGVKRYGDIRQVTGADLEAVDLICGGFPCQPVSVAGKRLAQSDERWLWPEFYRIVCLVRPRYVLVENVPGLLTAGIGDVLGDLAASGYDAEWSVLSACSLGAPHTRERLFIMAYPKYSERRPPDSETFRYAGRQDHIQPVRAKGATESQQRGWWFREPAVGRVANGLPNWFHRIRGLGNAVIPQAAEFIGLRIQEVDRILAELTASQRGLGSSEGEGVPQQKQV